jgi:hypothetical protein
MKRTFVSLAVGFLVAVIVYLALPPTMYVEKALNILVAAFVGSAVVTAFVLGRWGHHR